jgi:hypothetical protein
MTQPLRYLTHLEEFSTASPTKKGSIIGKLYHGSFAFMTDPLGDFINVSELFPTGPAEKLFFIF